MLKGLWQQKWSVLSLLAIWLVFECSVSWMAFCDQAQGYGGSHPSPEGYECIFNGPVVSIGRYFVRIWRDIFDKADAYVALFTLVLAISTINLWSATKTAAERQEKDTRILQRAYLSVEPFGIRPYIVKDLPPAKEKRI